MIQAAATHPKADSATDSDRPPRRWAGPERLPEVKPKEAPERETHFARPNPKPNPKPERELVRREREMAPQQAAKKELECLDWAGLRLA